MAWTHLPYVILPLCGVIWALWYARNAQYMLDARQGFVLLMALMAPAIALVALIVRTNAVDLLAPALIVAFALLTIGLFVINRAQESSEPGYAALDALDDGLIMLDPLGRIAFCNLAAYRLLNINQRIPHRTLPEELEHWLSQSDGPTDFIHRVPEDGDAPVIIDKNDPGRLLDVRVAPFGNPEGWHGHLIQLRDVTERERTRDELRAQHDLVEAIIQTSVTAIVVVDSGGHIVFANEHAEDILGLERSERSEWTYRNFDWTITGTDGGPIATEQLPLRHVLQAGTAIHDMQCAIKWPDGTRKLLSINGAPLPSENGTASKVVFSVSDVTEQRRREAELEHAKAAAEIARQQADDARLEAEKMNRLKSAFLANMSHEIRTPLTSIIGFAEVLGEESSSTHRHFAELIASGAHRLLETLNSVLELSRLEADAPPLHPELMCVASEVQDILNFMQPLAQSKDVQLCYEAPDAPLWAEVDTRAFNRALTNLVSNAIKFTEPGGEVSVCVRLASDGIEVTVTDTGIGIDADFLPTLFDPFTQESTGPRRKHEGSGLGLAITKRLIDLMDGTIDVTSTPGQGTTFSVHFGRASQEAVATQGQVAA